MTRKIEVETAAYVTIVIADDAPEDVFSRMQDPEVYESLYGPMTEEQVIEHWTHNCISNGVEGIERLDGWADLKHGMVVAYVSDLGSVYEL